MVATSPARPTQHLASQSERRVAPASPFRNRRAVRRWVGSYDSNSLIANADAALYRAKADGRHMMRFFDPEMDRHLRERYALQHDLRSAVAHDELALHYQPQAKIDGEVFGFEALLRWHHPKRGLVSPATFIPLGEQSGMIAEIGAWTLRQACREAATWPIPLQVGVNLSPVQFRHGDLAGLVHESLWIPAWRPGGWSSRSPRAC
jgi:predicted signal transduction protein with EAL and GGDEF domain